MPINDNCQLNIFTKYHTLIMQMLFSVHSKGFPLGFDSRNEEVTPAFTVRSTKSRNRLPQLKISDKQFSPLMLASTGIMSKPDLAQHRFSSQIINMPVRALTDPQVVPASCSHSPWPESAPDIEIPAFGKSALTQTTHLNPFQFGVFQQQNIGARQFGLQVICALVVKLVWCLILMCRAFICQVRKIERQPK
jgi:hypothetical protein